MTRVINIKDAPDDWKTDPQYVYIGRSKDPALGYWGNPYPLKRQGDRELVISQYAADFRVAVEDSYFLKRVLELQGKVLVCYCKPKACHGDVIVDFISAYEEEWARLERATDEWAKRKPPQQELKTTGYDAVELYQNLAKAQQASQFITDFESFRKWRKDYLRLKPDLQTRARQLLGDHL